MNTLSHPHSVISLSTYFSETIFPQRLYAKIFLLLVLLKASSYWLISKWQHIQEPLSVIAMFRVGDIQDYPLIAAFSKLQFGESVLYEHLGRGITHFPVVSTFPYALGLRLFGATGFIVADLFIALCYYVTVVVLLRILGVSRILSECIGLLVVSRGLFLLFNSFRYIYGEYRAFRFPLLVFLGLSAIFLCLVVLSRKWYRSHNDNSKLLVRTGLVTMGITLLLSLGPVGTPVWWGWRLLRPFVTEILSLLAICIVCRLLYHSKKNFQSKTFQLLWFYGGVNFAVLFQSDIYSAEITIIALLGVIIYCFITSYNTRKAWINFVKGGIIFLVTTIICSSPFLWQYWFAHPDTSRRLGVVPIDRTQILFLPGWAHYFVLGLLWICGVFLIKLFRGHYHGRERIWRQDMVVILLLFCVAAVIALPVSVIVLGKGVQLYHFSSRFRKYFSYAAIIFFLYTLSFLPKYFPKPLKRNLAERSRKLFLIGGVIFLSILSSLGDANLLSQKRTHMRDEFKAYGSFGNYRSDFLGVVNELLHQKREGNRVIGTFDHQLYSWWVTFADGYAFVPDPLFCPLSDREIEYRLGVFCKLLNMSSEEFRNFIKQDYVNLFWLGHNKYKVSKIYSFSPISDYETEDIRKKIERAGFLGGVLAIPISEQERLVKQYEALKSIPKHLKLDLIVLSNDTFLKYFHPPEETFELTYENSTFRVWKRKFNETY